MKAPQMNKLSLKHVKVSTGYLEETNADQTGIVMQGTLDAATLDALLTDSYQRKPGTLASLSDVLDALNKGEHLPTIDLGMRGENFIEHQKADGSFTGSFTLKDPVYIIDGLQRITGIKHFLQCNPGAEVRQSFLLHFNTDYDFEAKRFDKLNNARKKLASNVSLRNMKETHTSIATLYGLTQNEKTFPLYGRVCWEQSMQKGEIVPAMTFARVVGLLHSHKASTKYARHQELVPALDKVADEIGLNTLRENVHTFFDLVDQCFGIRIVTYRDGATWLRGTFLMTLARVLADHQDFWKNDGKKLFLDMDFKRKLKSFNVMDPTIKGLSSSSGKSRDLLYAYMVDHINSGKRQNRLRKHEIEADPSAKRTPANSSYTRGPVFADVA